MRCFPGSAGSRYRHWSRTVFFEEEKVNFETEQFRLNVGLAEMLKGGVIMDVVNAEQAVIAESAGPAAVMALERVPSDIRKEGGVARMSQIRIIREIMKAVSIPGMAKVRIGHFTEPCSF